MTCFTMSHGSFSCIERVGFQQTPWGVETAVPEQLHGMMMTTASVLVRDPDETIRHSVTEALLTCVTTQHGRVTALADTCWRAD